MSILISLEGHLILRVSGILLGLLSSYYFVNLVLAYEERQLPKYYIISENSIIECNGGEWESRRSIDFEELQDFCIEGDKIEFKSLDTDIGFSIPNKQDFVSIQERIYNNV